MYCLGAGKVAQIRLLRASWTRQGQVKAAVAEILFCCIDATGLLADFTGRRCRPQPLLSVDRSAHPELDDPAVEVIPSGV